MRILIDLDDRHQVVDLEAWQPTATLAALIAGVGGSSAAAQHVCLDGRSVPVDMKLQDAVLLEGSVISLQPGPGLQRITGWNVSISGGLGSGALVPVPHNRKLIIGRSPKADLVLDSESASWHHCTLEFDSDELWLRDAESTNGTIVDGVPIPAEGLLVTGPTTVLAGGAVLSIRPDLRESAAPRPGSLHNLTPAATAPFNRPPRSGDPAPPEPLAPPQQKDIPPASKFSVVTVVAPLIMAGVMVAAMGSLRYALFALLSPVMAVGMWFEQKRRRAKNVEEEDKRFTEALDEFRGEITEMASLERERRQQLIPDPALVLRRAVLPSTLLWQRRADAADFGCLNAGTADIEWHPEIDSRGISKLDDKVKQIVDETRLPAAPVLVDLTDAGVVGIVGDRTGALALARSLLIQSAVHCGPADLTVGVFCDGGRESDWEWASWLPHTRQAGDSSHGRWMSNQRDESSAMLRSLREAIDTLPTAALLVVLDSEVLTEGRESPAREILGHGRSAKEPSLRPGQPIRRVSGIVIARTADQLPAACTTVIDVAADAAASVAHPGDLTTVTDVTLAGIGLRQAETCARQLAHFDDPELVVPGAALPSLVRLPELLAPGGLDVDAIIEGWQAPTGISTPIGLSESGPLMLDLVRDGPHGLVGGTTGSGKSEFLRSFVAGLAARSDPTVLNFILIDFKGGAAFKTCERLPHTIGTISNLDEQLADRALRALEAEMQRRQRLFSEAGEDVDNLPAYLATNPAEPLPRLLLVIDEFAMLAKDFPDVLASLVSVAAVGRTLGVHMVLATQRPAGVVNDDILANTNLRVALRVQSREDSTNVIGVPSASAIGRTQTGRAYVKLGQDEITPVQTALVTGQAQQAAQQLVEIRDVGRFGVPIVRRTPRPANSDDNDLDLLIDAIVEANHRLGIETPRQVWPEALGEKVRLDGYAAEASEASSEPTPNARPQPMVGGLRRSTVAIALADEPDLQRQSATGWDMAEGNLLLMGLPGSGTTTTLSSIALALAQSLSPGELDLVCLDVGSRDLAPLAELPHTVAYVGAGAGAKERQARFLRFLRAELDRRRESDLRHRPMVVLIDGLAGLRDEFQDYDGQQLLECLYRAYADGPGAGMFFAVSTTRARAVPSAMDEVTTQKWVFRLADSYDYSTLGIRGKTVPAAVPGRCVSTTKLLQMHIATPGRGLQDAVREAAARWQDLPGKPEVIGVLPDDVPSAELAPLTDLSGEPWLIPVGRREDSLQPACLELYEGEHLLIAGPARSGKSTLLLAIAQVLRAGGGAVRPAIWGIFDRRSPLAEADLDRAAGSPDEIPALLASLRLESGPVFLLIDDAERIDDADQSITSLLNAGIPGLCVIAAGRSADLRALYNHWTKVVRKSRCGVLLQPDIDFDGDLLGVTIPRRAPVAMTQGRGYACVSGALALIQSMSPVADRIRSGA